MKLAESCSNCGRKEVQTKIPVGKTLYVVFKCGHVNTHFNGNGTHENNVISSPVSVVAAPAEGAEGQPALTDSSQAILEPNSTPPPTPIQVMAAPTPTPRGLLPASNGFEIPSPQEILNLTPSHEATPLTNCDAASYTSCDSTMKSYDFQTEGVKFIEQSNLRCLIADATGLGKTIQALIALRENREKAFPALILVKGGLIYQWSEEFRRWCDSLPMRVMPVTSRTNLIPGFHAYVMSMDLFTRLKKEELEKTGLLGVLGIKTIILDEVHNYKNPSSKRTINLITYIQNLDIEHIIALSATPIKNKADEYFTILNLLDPGTFHSLDRFRKRWLMQNDKYQWTRINPYYLQKFKDLTSKYILRREKHEVLTNLPPLSRNFVYVEIEDEKLKGSYNKALDMFSNYLNDPSEAKNATTLLGWLAKLRAITGESKCQNAIEFAQEHLDSTEENLCIGIHHTVVRDTLKYIFQGGGYACESLSGEDSAMKKDRIVQAFMRDDIRLLILNMKSGGEGLNLQNCANALVLERAWNAADEEQFEGRFHRNGQISAVTVTYFIARGTVDMFFHELISKKRQIVGETVSKEWNFSSDLESIRELSEIVVNNKL
jgi:SNF2 family DNA or RNA helicase